MNILVPTDFSTCADNAFRYAYTLAKDLRASLHLYHATDPSNNEEHNTVAAQDAVAVSTSTKAVYKKMEALRAKALELDIKTEIHTSDLPFIKTLGELVESLSIDLVVLGSNGRNGKEEDSSWGSQAIKVVREMHTKVLVVQSGQQAPDFSTVMFATSLDKKERAVFTELLAFLDHFDVDRIHIVAVDTPNYFSQPSIIMTTALQEFKELGRQYDCVTHFFRSGSVEEGIRKFSAEYNVDLIALTNSHKSKLMRMIQGGKLESLVGRSTLPVLSIPS